LVVLALRVAAPLSATCKEIMSHSGWEKQVLNSQSRLSRKNIIVIQHGNQANSTK
jgi:hypothetical protein